MTQPASQLRNYLNNQAQASIEFTLALVLGVLFLVLSCNLFVWLNHSLVQRQLDYEKTRITTPGSPGRIDFYTNQTPLNVFKLGGYEK